jgi:GAF domain-containing protein
MRDLESLLPYAVNLIQQRTNFYHVQIFLIDEAREFAVLRASTGDVGRQLLEAGHRLAIGSASVIGQVAERGQPVIAHDTEDSSTIHRKNPVLPDTRAEMALPLRVGARIIGALDVQSRQPGVFQDNDVRMFGLLADQLAVAIDNAQLFQESNERLQEINELNQQLVGRAWRDYLQQRGDQAVGVVAGMHDNVALDTTLTADMAQALSREDVVTRRSGEGAVIALPVRLGEASIGALEFEVEAESIDPETLELAQALADRLALTLENARLFEQAQRLGQRESVVNQVSSTLTGITDMDELLQTAVRELGRALRIPETTIRLMDIRAPAAAPNGGDGQSAPPEHPGGVDADLQEG